MQQRKKKGGSALPTRPDQRDPDAVRHLVNSVLLDSIERSILLRPLDRLTKAQTIAAALRLSKGYHWLGLYDVTLTLLSAIAWTGALAPTRLTFSRSKGLNGKAVASGQSFVVQDVAQNPRVFTTRASSKAKAVFPVTVCGVIVGTIDVESDRVGSFTQDDEELLAGAAQMLRPLWDGINLALLK